MRILTLAILTIATASAAAPTLAQAQAWDPAYPVCMQVFGLFNLNDCSYTSLPQCVASARGRAAECMVNPYFANAGAPVARPHRRHRSAY